MPKCFCAFVVLKYECVFEVSELYRMPRHFRQNSVWRKIAANCSREKKYQLKLLHSQDQGPRLTEFCETEICIKLTKSSL